MFPLKERVGKNYEAFVIARKKIAKDLEKLANFVK